MNIPLYILLGVLIFLLIFLMFFLFLKIRLEITYKKENNKKGKILLVASFFWKKVRKEVSFKDKNEENKKSANHIKDNNDNLSFGEKIEKYRIIFEEMRYVWSKSKRKIRKNIFAEKIFIDMSVGFEDAFVTGITTGSLWAFVYTVIGLLSDIIKISVPEVDIKPVYNEDYFEADAKCTVASSHVNIIGIGLKILVNYYIIKKKIEKETKKEKAEDNYGNTN